MISHKFSRAACFSKTQYFVISLLLLVSLIACSPVARFLPNKPVNLITGKQESVSINVSNWSDRHQLTLLNGGPYLANSFSTPVPTKMLQKYNELIVAIDANNDLLVIDFQQNPAKLVLEFPLEDEVTALATYENDIYIGFQNTGAIRLQKPDRHRIKVHKIIPDKNITRIRISNDSVYFLSDGENIVSAHLPSLDNNPGKSVLNYKLPENTNDFAVTDDTFTLLGTGYGLGKVTLSNSSQFISTLKLQGSKQQIEIENSVAYVADGDGGMVLVDLQDKNNLRWLGSHNKLESINKVISNNKKALVIDRSSRLVSINVGNPQLPITGSFYKPASEINDAISDNKPDNNTAYIATALGVEQIVFPDSSHQQISNEGINQGGTRRAFIENNMAYVADWFSGLHIYDISNPAALKHIGNFHTPGSSKGVVVENGYAYVGDDDFGLQIIDVKDPSNPKSVGSVLTTGLAYTLKKIGNVIYLADHRGGFHIIDAGDVTKPKILSTLDTPGKSWAIDVKDNIAYVADDTSGVLVFDVSNATKPEKIGQFNPDGYAEDIVIRGNIAYVSFFDKGLYLLDISDPAKPITISHLYIPGNARSIVLQGNYAYIAGWESGLNIVDISEIRSPKLMGSFDTRGSAWGADVQDDYAYVWDWWGGVKVVDISNPAFPQLVSQYHASGKINKLRLKNNFIYTANQKAGVQVFDVNNVLNPIWSTGTDIEGSTVDVWPAAETNYLYAVSNKAGLVTMDISDPFYIRQVNQTPIEGNAHLVREHNGYVYVATTEGVLYVFDVNKEQTPEKIQTVIVNVNDIWTTQSGVFVASPDEGLVSFSVTDNGSLSRKKQLLSDTAKIISSDGIHLAAAIKGNNVALWLFADSKAKPLTTLEIEDNILDLIISDNTLLVYSATKGLLHYTLDRESTPFLTARYPATDDYEKILLHNDAVFFAGQNTIASIQLLPEITWKTSAPEKLEFSIQGKLPTGNYHLAITGPDGSEAIWPNALNVSMGKGKKSKLSIEDFQKLLKQHRKNQQLP